MNFWCSFSGKDCGFPGRPGNGTTIGAEKFFYPGEEVTFECDNGYILFGGDRRICQEDGSWSGSLPECSKIQFYELDNSIHNMSVKLCYILASYIQYHRSYFLRAEQKTSVATDTCHSLSTLKMALWSCALYLFSYFTFQHVSVCTNYCT